MRKTPDLQDGSISTLVFLCIVYTAALLCWLDWKKANNIYSFPIFPAPSDRSLFEFLKAESLPKKLLHFLYGDAIAHVYARNFGMPQKVISNTTLASLNLKLNQFLIGCSPKNSIHPFSIA
ncbi:MAG: hypothetical protein AAB444_00815 [Patescibacteria group bacterium]